MYYRRRLYVSSALYISLYTKDFTFQTRHLYGYWLYITKSFIEYGIAAVHPDTVCRSVRSLSLAVASDR